MKRWTSVCLLCLLYVLSACGQKVPEASEWTAEAMVQAILASQGTVEETQTIVWGDALFDTYAGGYYGLSPDELTDGAAAYAGGVSALEVAVVRLADGADPSGAVQALEEYIDSRAGAFAGYAPEQYAILEGARAVRNGQYAALLICPDAAAAEAAFIACFGSQPAPPVLEPAPVERTQPDPEPAEPPEQEAPQDQEPAPIEPEPPNIPPDETEPAEPPDQPDPGPKPEPEPELDPEPEPEPAPETGPEPEEPWSYDAQRILDAWSTGSRDGLREQDLAILEVLDGIPALTDSSLTDYERELALHDWMIAWAEYDPGALSSGPIGEPIPDNDNPYGFLVGRKGICLGYASTFHLLMDLSSIACVTVHGMSHAGTAEHAWNLVQLDGEWYAVDPTWDDPVTSFQVSEATAHQYFNVTDEFLRQHDHQWDESACPSAEGTLWTWS